MFLEYLFTLIYSWHFFYFIFLTVSLVNLRQVKEWDVWTEREQKIDASTAVWHLARAWLSHF